MPINIGQFYGTPSGPRAEIVPSFSFASFSETIPANGEMIVPHSTNVPPISTEWLVGVRSWASWEFQVERVDGASLRIDKWTFFPPHIGWSVYPLWGGTITENAGILLTGWRVRFTIINGSVLLDNYVQGLIKVQAVL